ncbi:MAG: endonuclease [Anaerolineales bacterium]|nr:endonuclease [Anaerolineales bacterium]
MKTTDRPVRQLARGIQPGQPQVYLLHFSRPLHHARHYVGFVEYDLEQRIEHHLAGRGARLVAAVAAAGIDVQLARVWPGATRTFERRLKRWHGSAQFCPLCDPAAAERAILKTPLDSGTRI